MSLTVAELRSALSSLSLDSRGNKHTLRTRLAKHSRLASNPSPLPPVPVPPPTRARPEGQEYDSFLVFDVEATCESIKGNPKLAFSYPNEIIEWPVILLQWRESPCDSSAPSHEPTYDLVTVDEFHSFVRPTWNPKLSEFCTELTGITQEQVDGAPRFQKLLRKFDKEFIAKHGLFTKENRTVWVTDGPWDLRDFVAKTCFLSKVPRPDWLAGEIIDLKLSASHYFSNLKKQQQQQQRRPAPDSPLSNRSSTPSPPPPSPPSSAAPLPSTSTTIASTRRPSVTPPPPPRTELGEPSSPPLPEDSVSVSPLPSCPLLLTCPPDLSIPSVLAALSLDPFIGRQHSGLDDARNLARIVIAIAAAGSACGGGGGGGVGGGGGSRGSGIQFKFIANRTVPDGGKGGRERRWGWMARGGECKWERYERAEMRRTMTRINDSEERE